MTFRKRNIAAVGCLLLAGAGCVLFAQRGVKLGMAAINPSIHRGSSATRLPKTMHSNRGQTTGRKQSRVRDLLTMPGNFIKQRSRNFNFAAAPAMSMGRIPAAVIAIQAIALLGATYTGSLAKKRRMEMKQLNDQLRQINQELRSRDAALIEKEAVLNYIQSQEDKSRLEDDNTSEEERTLDALIADGTQDIAGGNYIRGQEKLTIAKASSESIGDPMLRVRSRRALAAGFKASGDMHDALGELISAYEVCGSNVQLNRKKCAVAGEIADMYADMGDFKKAAQYYDVLLGGM